MLPLVLWEIRVERASVILIDPNQPGFPDLTELLEAPPCRSPAGSICYPRWRGTRTWNYGAIMCDRFRGIRGDGRLTVSHAHGSAKTLYKTFVCMLPFLFCLCGEAAIWFKATTYPSYIQACIIWTFEGYFKLSFCRLFSFLAPLCFECEFECICDLTSDIDKTHLFTDLFF